MILVVCTDDPALVGQAQAQSLAHPGVFGQTYQVFTAVPNLGLNENLFVIAHGAYRGDDNNPVIGDHNAAFYVNAVELWENIQGIVPGHYTGSVYISACESGDHVRGSFSFAEVFSAQLRGHRADAGYAYGQNGAVVGPIPNPDDPSWVRG